MSNLVAVAVTIGAPDTAGQVPVTTSNLAADIAQAVTDLSTLAAAIAVVATDATTTDNDMATLQTDLATANTDVGTTNTDAGAADTQVGTVGTDLDAVATNATFGLTILLNNQTYNVGTKQYSGVPAVSATLTVAQQQGLIALLNALGTAQVTAKIDAAAALTAAGIAVTAAGVAVTQGTTVKADTASTKTAAVALSTTPVNTDLTNAQALIAAANLFLQSDATVITNCSTLNAALVAALTFIRQQAILAP